jgi:Flp pilus assembly pilin Flp
MYSIDWQRILTAVGHYAVAQEGQVLIEYALVLALVALATIGVLQAMGVHIDGILNGVGNGMSSVSNP